MGGIEQLYEKTGEKISIKTLHKEDLRNYKVSTDKAKKELDIVFQTNLIPKRDQAINNCYFILMDIIRNK